MPAPSKVIGPFEVVSNFYGTTEQKTEGARVYAGHPVRVAMPVPEGKLRGDEPLVVRDADGRPTPALTRPVLLWPDGSVRIVEAWLPLDLRQGERRSFTLDRGTPASMAIWGADPAEPESGRVIVTMKDGTPLEASVPLPRASDSRSAPWAREDETGFELHTASGKLAFRGAIIRRAWSWYAGADYSIRLINHVPGEAYTVRGARLELDLPLARGRTSRHLTKANAVMANHPRFAEMPEPFTIASDPGGVRATSVAQMGVNESDYPDYERPGLTSVANWVLAADETAGWLLVVPEARERCPKGWRFDPRNGRVIVELHPESAAPLEWRRGMALFQRFQLLRTPPDIAAEDAEDLAWSWLRPPIVKVDPDAYRAAGWRIPFRHDPARFPKTENHFRQTFNFSWRRGAFDWGDDSLDSLSARWASLKADQKWQTVMRNNEYDFVASSAKEFARTGRFSVFEMCRNAAEHQMYTDFVAVSDDPWKEGGVPAHCIAHTTGSAYPSHMWIEGLVLYHMLCGDPYARRVAERIGDFFLQYIHERWHVLNGTGREGGWTLIALAAIYDLTRADRYLVGIKKLVDFYLSHPPDNFYKHDATFCVGIALIGLDRASAFHRREESERFMLAVMDWMMEHRRTPEGLFDYFFDSQNEGLPYVMSKLPDAINTCYRISGDEKYLRCAWRLYQASQSLPLTIQEWGHYESGYAAAAHLTWMGCLQSFAEKGWLDAMQYPEPTTATPKKPRRQAARR